MTISSGLLPKYNISQGSLNHSNLFLSVLVAGKSKIKLLDDSVLTKAFFDWLTGGCLLAMSLRGLSSFPQCIYCLGMGWGRGKTEAGEGCKPSLFLFL